MEENEQIHLLRRRLKREAAGPLLGLSNHMTASLFSLLRTLAQWVHETAQERPLITLLFAFGTGFMVARLGRGHAKY